MSVQYDLQGEDSSNQDAPSPYAQLEIALGYTFKSKDNLVRALTHRSVPGTGSKHDYERLEFLGDAVLDLVVAHLLLDCHDSAREGDLSKMRAALVNTSSLAFIAKRIGLNTHVKLSRGELANGGAERPSILADVLEAVMGAIYRESGYETAMKVAAGLFGDSIENVTPRDPKTELQEGLHALGLEAPTYLLEAVEGPEHAPTFISILQVADQVAGRGKGATKKASQQSAAAQVLVHLKDCETTEELLLKLSKSSKE